MFINTPGLVLNVYPFRDKKIISKIFTKESGIVSFIVTSNIKQKPLSQVLTIAEITYKKSANRSLFYVKDVAVGHFYRSLTTNVKKIQVAMVLCEILNKCLKEKNPDLYDFVISAFKYLDSNCVFVGFDTLFLIKLCDVTGISPFHNLSSELTGTVLNIQEGCFSAAEKHIKKEMLVPQKESLILYRLSKLSFQEASLNNISIELNKNLFNYMTLYVSEHLADLTKLKSTQVLKELE